LDTDHLKITGMNRNKKTSRKRALFRIGDARRPSGYNRPAVRRLNSHILARISMLWNLIGFRRLAMDLSDHRKHDAISLDDA
jgi:hypothetical protein